MVERKIIIKILDDFKYSMFIRKSLKTFEVNHVDFFEALELEENEDLKARYHKIDNLNAKIFEDEVAERAFHGVERGSDKIFPSEKLTLEMIKANNRKKYTPKITIETEKKITDMSDEELENMIKKLQGEN